MSKKIIKLFTILGFGSPKAKDSMVMAQTFIYPTIQYMPKVNLISSTIYVLYVLSRILKSDYGQERSIKYAQITIYILSLAMSFMNFFNVIVPYKNCLNTIVVIASFILCLSSLCEDNEELKNAKRTKFLILILSYAACFLNIILLGFKLTTYSSLAIEIFLLIYTMLQIFINNKTLRLIYLRILQYLQMGKTISI